MILSERHVTFPFTWALRGPCKVIHWSGFNIVVFQGIREACAGGERDGRMVIWRSSQNTHNIYQLSSSSYVDTPKQYNRNIKKSLITDHHNKNNDIEKNKKLKYCRSYQNVTQRHEVRKCYWRHGAKRCAQHRFATNLQFAKSTISAKCGKVKHNKMRRACVLVMDAFSDSIERVSNPYWAFPLLSSRCAWQSVKYQLLPTELT